jgi:hypothetical protein
VDLELVTELAGEPREPSQVLVESGGLAVRLPHEHFVVEEVEEGVRVAQDVGERRQVVFHEDALAARPASALVVQEARQVSALRPRLD